MNRYFEFIVSVSSDNNGVLWKTATGTLPSEKLSCIQGMRLLLFLYFHFHYSAVTVLLWCALVLMHIAGMEYRLECLWLVNIDTIHAVPPGERITAKCCCLLLEVTRVSSDISGGINHISCHEYSTQDDRCVSVTVLYLFQEYSDSLFTMSGLFREYS